MEFGHGLPIVGDVLEHVAAQNDVELPLVERQGCDVGLCHIRRARVKIRPDVTQRRSLEVFLDRLLRCEVE